MYTFERLSVMPREQLEDIHKQCLEDLSEAQREKWQLIGKIMFLQNETEKNAH